MPRVKILVKYDSLLSDAAKQLIIGRLGEEFIKCMKGWDIYCAAVKNSYCNYRDKTITISENMILKGNPNPDNPCNNLFWVYVVAHELAHAFNVYENGNKVDSHGPSFMKWFKKLCPEDLQIFEYEYKPRNARRAGVSGYVKKGVECPF